MKSTALGAENIIFISDAHEKFYYEKLQEVRYQDVYHKALCYCLGINGDTRKNADRIYNFKTGSVKTKCLHEGWQTSGSLKVVRIRYIYKRCAVQDIGLTEIQAASEIAAYYYGFTKKEVCYEKIFVFQEHPV